MKCVVPVVAPGAPDHPELCGRDAECINWGRSLCWDHRFWTPPVAGPFDFLEKMTIEEIELEMNSLFTKIGPVMVQIRPVMRRLLDQFEAM